MDGSSSILIVMPSMILVVLFTGIALPFIAASRSGPMRAAGLARADALTRINAAGRKARRPKPGANNAAPVEYLYVPCARIRYHGYSAEMRRWVQEVPIVKRTAKWIYYASDSWDRGNAVVGPGRISREEFETGTRHGYPVGVIPVPGDRPRPGPAGGLFFATREAAEADLYRRERERAEPAARHASPIRELRRRMADAHPDHGGTVEQFIEALRRYEMAL